MNCTLFYLSMSTSICRHYFAYLLTNIFIFHDESLKSYLVDTIVYKCYLFYFIFDCFVFLTVFDLNLGFFELENQGIISASGLSTIMSFILGITGS